VSDASVYATDRGVDELTAGAPRWSVNAGQQHQGLTAVGIIECSLQSDRTPGGMPYEMRSGQFEFIQHGNEIVA
jgi:hypothetical protein